MSSTQESDLPEKVQRPQHEDKCPFFQIDFRCENKGKFIGSTKRKMRWRYGCVGSSPRENGKSSGLEEHEVSLEWSVLSGKLRVFHDQKEIKVFSCKEIGYDQLVVHWKSPETTQLFQVSASSQPYYPNHNIDLRIGNWHFFDLPHYKGVFNDRNKLESGGRSEENMGDIGDNDLVGNTFVEPSHLASASIEKAPDCDESPHGLDFRLAIAGFRPSLQSLDSTVILEDELMSDSFSNPFESLRHRLIASIPQTDDLISRALVNILSASDNSEGNTIAPATAMAIRAVRAEAAAILEVEQWIESHPPNWSGSDLDEESKIFLQGKIENIFQELRSDRLTEDDAFRVLCTVSMMLGLQVKDPFGVETLVMRNLHPTTTKEDIQIALQIFGEVQRTAVLQDHCFGVCWFSSPGSVDRVLQATDMKSISINGVFPTFSKLQRRVYLERPVLCKRSQSTPCVALHKPTLSRRRSHQRNTVTLDTSMSTNMFLHAEVGHVISPPESSLDPMPPFFANVDSRFFSLAESSSANAVTP